LIAADVSQVPSLAARQELYRAEGIRSLLLVPLRSRGRAEGTLAFYHRRPHAFDEVEVAVASALANLAASALDSAALYERQARLRAEAQRQREELRVTLASIGDGVLTTDVEGRVTSLNPVAGALTGWPAAEAA